MNDRTHEQQADDSKQERIIDVVRDIRDQAECYHDAWLNDPVEFCDNEIIVHKLCSIADRIEVAWKRERAEAELYWSGIGHAEAVAEFKWGNKAVMRKALEAARAALSSYADGGDEDNAETNAALAEIDAALAAPARNCDRFRTAGEAMDAFWEEEAPADGETLFAQVLNWLFAPAEGGAR